ncbi:9952_t:CDS:2 [Cetraspora pellucida]|uniref:9952_t:CDS:1 n=1 Tax=Cetraspora pellucida TaxID=1433469 RepID=A0A9N9IZE8_9GLOM|nr:9952_t:CDS:2 [Cetraspora pellucida]
MNSFFNEKTNSCIKLDTEHDISLDNSYYANTFATWNDVIQHINAYAIEQEFAMRLNCTEKSLDVTIRAKIVCHHAVITNTEYYVKYINLEHNHLIDTAVAVFDSSYHKLSNSKNNQVLMLYNSGILVPIIIRILNKEYRRYIHNKDIFQQLKQAASNTVNRIQMILTNKDLALLSAIRAKMLHVKYQICTWHVKQNIVRNLSSKLKEKFVAFSKDFKIVMTKNTEDQFNISWNKLITEYSESSNYIEQ